MKLCFKTPPPPPHLRRYAVALTITLCLHRVDTTASQQQRHGDVRVNSVSMHTA